MLIPEWVSFYVSIPYEEIDCWGLIKLVYKERYELDVGDIEDQRLKIREDEWRDVLHDRVGLMEGDVLLFKSTPINRHVGLLITSEYMLHSRKPAGVVIEKWTHRQWKHQLTACYRHRSR